jgi:hypothetical protein
MTPSAAPRDGKILVVPPPEQGARQKSADSDERQEFSLVLGGPLYQVLRRLHLSGDGLELVRQRLLVALAILWLPLLAFSIMEGQAWGGRSAVPFLWDIEANVRLLIAVPLLIVAELIVHQRMRLVVRQFLDRNLIPKSALLRFDGAIASALRLRNSVPAEVLLIVLVYLVGVMIVWRNFVALSTAATWYAIPEPGGMTLSRTGKWYVFVSLPLFQFLLMRWYYRVLIWMRFLWQVSRIELSLIPTHPDRVGGLGFLANVSFAFTPLALAHGALLAGMIANRIVYLRATLPDFKLEIVIVLLFLLCLALGPLLVFAPQLAEAKRNGLREYGTLAEQYVREFDKKWLRRGVGAAGETLVGSADIQSLADLANSFEVVTTMRVAPITREALIGLTVATLAPVVPLLLTMMSLEDLLKKLAGVLF